MTEYMPELKVMTLTIELLKELLNGLIKTSDEINEKSIIIDIRYKGENVDIVFHNPSWLRFMKKEKDGD